MVYYVFDTSISSIGNNLLRLNTSRSMALTFPAVPGKYYEMSLADLLLLLTSSVPLRLAPFFQSAEEGAGFNIGIDLLHHYAPESMAVAFPNQQKEIIMKRVSQLHVVAEYIALNLH